MTGEQSPDRAAPVAAGHRMLGAGHPLVLLSVAVAAVLALMPTITDSFPIGTAAISLVIFVISLLAGRRLDRLLPGVVVVAIGLAAAIGAGLIFSDPYGGPLLIILTVIVPGLIGRSMGQRAQLIAAAAERARLEERGRIAAEMHDLIGHELSLLALRAGALELDDDLPGQHRDTAAQLRRGAHLATQRLTEVLTLLRANDRPPLRRDPTPRPSIAPSTRRSIGPDLGSAPASVDDLAHRAAAAGVPATLEWRQITPDDLGPRTTQLVSDVVREGLTNAIKHAPGQPVAVIISGESGRVVAAVGNPTGSARPTGIGTGSGITAFRRRIEAAGGTLRAGPAGEYFELVAELDTKIRSGQGDR